MTHIGLRPQGPVAPRAWPGLLFFAFLAGCPSKMSPQVDAALPTEPPSPDAHALASDIGVAADVPPDVAPDVAPDIAPDIAPDLRPDAPVAYTKPHYTKLSETGLFKNLPDKAIAYGVVAFQPRYVLWSDGADKKRWISLPPGTQIDTADMDHWNFPIGTKLWKEFARGPNLLETRLVERYGSGPDDYFMGAFVWLPDGSDAVFSIDGAVDVNGSTHDVPAQKLCAACHNGDTGRVLGFSAVQLSQTSTGPTVRSLATDGTLSHPPSVDSTFSPVGDELTASALGYLHANCGHCHNPRGTSWPDTQLNLRLDVGNRKIEDVPAYQSAVRQKLTYFVRRPGLTLRIAPGDPAASGVTVRMVSRVQKEAMPPLATKIVDAVGLDLVTRWISAMPN